MKTPHASVLGSGELSQGFAEASGGREVGGETAAGRSPGKSATQRRCLLEQIVTGHKKDRACLPHGHAVLAPWEVGHPAVKKVARLWVETGQRPCHVFACAFVQRSNRRRVDERSVVADADGVAESDRITAVAR